VNLFPSSGIAEVKQEQQQRRTVFAALISYLFPSWFRKQTPPPMDERHFV
jgi:hypothetical protein